MANLIKYGSIQAKKRKDADASVAPSYAGLYLVGEATPNGWSLDNATDD